MRIAAALLLSLLGPLFGIEAYFRKIEGTGSSMQGIDCIYMINLDERPEKFERSAALLVPYGIEPLRVSAVNGWKLPLEALGDLGVKCQPWMATSRMATCYLPEEGGRPRHEPMQEVGRTYFCHCMSRGSVGIVLSHLSVLQHAYDKGFETIWVLEDDIEILRDPRQLSDLIEELDGLVGERGWDVLFTDRDTKNSYGQYVPNTACAWVPNFVPYDPGRFERRQEVSSTLRRVGARFGAYSMIVRRSGMKKLLDFIKQHQIFIPYDIGYALPPQIRLFTVTEDVVSTQPGAPSDNGGPNYELEKREGT